MKRWKTTLAVSAALSASLALAEDFKTIDGKEYKDATVSRVEADGLVLKTKSGISKVYFVELPKDVQERFHYDAAKVAAKQNAALQQQKEAQRKARANAAWEYNDVPDKMGQHGVEHHAWTNSVVKGQARLVLSYGDGQTSIILKTDGVMNGDPEGGYWAAVLDVRFDDGPISRYEIHGASDNYREGFMVFIQSSGNWEKISPQGFIAALRNAQVVRIRVPMHGEGETVFTFNVAGLQW